MRRPRLSYANVTSSLALFIALGGTGYAVTKLPRNSVGATQLKTNAVTSAKIRAGAVQRSDLAVSARSGGGGSRGPRGAEGPAGPVGPSETIQLKRLDPIPFPPDAGGAVTLAKVTIGTGSWMLNAQTWVISAAPGGSDYFNCGFVTATGEHFGDGSVRVGDQPADASVLTVPSQGAITVTTATEISYVCTHSATIGGAPRAEHTVLLATRVGSLENR
jgi:hypothetical protein